MVKFTRQSAKKRNWDKIKILIKEKEREKK